MELRQLVYFEAVARLGGFGRAADHLRIAQPAVSAQIKRLENELGIRLFNRTTRSVVLSEAGALVLIRARAVLGQLDGVYTDIDALTEVLRGHLRLATTPILGTLDLPPLLAQFHHRYPEVTITLRTGLVSELLTRLDAGDVDVILGPIHPDLPAKYLSQPLVDEELVLAVPPHHPVARKSPLASVACEPFICLPAGSGLRTILIDAAIREGFTPRVQFETHGPASIRELVAAGLGVALLAASAAHAPGPVIDTYSLLPALAHPPIGTILMRENPVTPTTSAWLQQLNAALRTAV